MSGYLRPQSGYNKGIAQYKITTSQESIGAGTAVNCFETLVYNDTASISVSSSSIVVLKAGKKYKLALSLSGVMTASEWSNWRFYNRTTSTYIGGNITQNAVTKASPSLSASTAVVIVSATVDTSIDFRCVSIGSGTVTCTDGDIYVTIEELEEFIPQSNGSTTINGNLQITGGIIGRTDGVAPAAGMVGEILTLGSPTTWSAANGYVNSSTLTTITLTPGTWSLHLLIGAADALTEQIVIWPTNVGGNNVIGGIVFQALVQQQQNNGTNTNQWAGISFPVNITTNTTLDRFRSYNYGATARTVGAIFRAIRIA